MTIPRHNTWFWLPRRLPQTSQKNVFARENYLSVGNSGDGTALTGMDIVMTNTFAPVPLVGHNYASAQFIGPGQTQFQVVVHNVGTEGLREIQSMVEETQQNARSFRRVKDCARVYFTDNAFLQLAGIEDGIVESVESWTEPGTTDLYALKISFTVDGQHLEALTQELYSPANLQWRVIERILQDIQSNVSRSTQSISLSQSVETAAAQTIISGVNGASSGVMDSIVTGGGITDTITNAISGAFNSAVGTASSSVDEVIASVEVQLREEPGVHRLSQSTLALLRNDIGFREYIRRLNSGEQTQGLQELITGAIRNAKALASEVVRTGSVSQAINSALRNEIGEFIAIPSPAGANIREDIIFANNADRDQTWYFEAVNDTIRVLLDNQPSLPIHPFFEGPWAGEYFRITGAATQAQSASTQQRLREAEARRRAEDRGEGDANRQGREVISKRGQTNTATRDRFISTELNNIPTFLKPFTYGHQRYFVSRNILATAVRSYLTGLLEIGRNLLDQYSQTPEFEEIFPGLTTQYLQSRRITTNPAYPDIDLPPHPVSRRRIDTEPDFYFWNDSEESMLNQIGPELDVRLNRRLDRMLQSFQGVVSGDTWRQTYLGRSLYGPDHIAAESSYSLSGEPPSMECTGETSSPQNVQINPENGRIQKLSRMLIGHERSVSETVMSISPSVMGSSEGEASQITNVNRRSMMRNTVFNLQTDQPDPTMQVGPVDEVASQDEELGQLGYLGHSSTRDNIYNLAKQAIVQNPDETLTMRRAFPTFKLYFIEDDTGPDREHLLPQSRTVAYFDDFYNYNSVKEMRVVRNRKSPSHVAVITLTNVSGILDERMWNHQRWDPDTGAFINIQRENYEPGLQETELENPLDHLILKQGLKVQIRLGNSNNANKLPIKFNGEIVEIGYNHSSPDLITIVAQGYGAELTLEKKYQTDDNYTGFRDTADLLHTVMCSPELIHFGRFEVNPQFNPAEARSRISDGTGLWRAPSEILDEYRQHLIMARTPWVLANNPADDNIYAPNPTLYREWYGSLEEAQSTAAEILAAGARLTDIPVSFIRQFTDRVSVLNPISWSARVSPPIIINSILRNASAHLSPHHYIPTGQTIWEMFKEMELRHPGYISDCRPYGTRMTMFYGLPDQRYWADQITRGEMAILRIWERRFRAARDAVISRRAERSQEYVDEMSENLLRPLLVQGTRRTARAIYNTDPAQALFNMVDTIGLQLPINQLMGQVGTALGRTFGRFRPFRKYHIITSDHHILLNNVRASDKGTFNSVIIKYGGDGKTYTLKADDNIPDHKLKTREFSFPNCNSETMARRYCIGLLTRGLRDVYKGEIVITGKNIDPWDAVLLYDAYSDMYGPIEVEQVVDTFTRETGWITEITPDMCIHANEYSTTSTMNLMLDVGTELWSRYANWHSENRGLALGAAAAAGAATAVTGTAGRIGIATGLAAGAVAAGLGGYYFLRYTQERQPIWINPLIINNRPFTEGLYGFKHDGVFANIAGKLEAEVNRVSEGWRAFHLSGYIADWTIGTSRGIAGQSGQGAYSGVGNFFAVR